MITVIVLVPHCAGIFPEAGLFYGVATETHFNSCLIQVQPMSLLDRLREQRKTEQAQAKALRQTLAKAQNPVAAALIEALIEDSARSAAVLGALAEVRGGEAAADEAGIVTEDLLNEIRQATKSEAELLTRAGVLAREARDKRAKAILQSLLEEEKRRHSAMQALANLLQRDGATLADYLDLLQKYLNSPR